MKEKIAELLAKPSGLKEKEILSLIEMPKDSKFGDYSFPCFSLAKKFKKNPVEIAKEIAIKLENTLELENIEAVNGYVNFFISGAVLAEETLRKIQKEGDNFGSAKIFNEKVMVEFSQANTHKAFHIGHVRGTSIGESLARISSFLGNKTIRANYQGDTGMHVAKWIWCYQKYHKKEKLTNDEEWIASIYVDAITRLAEKVELQSEVEEINKKLEEKSDKSLNALWKKTRKASLNSFETIYKDLNTFFDVYFFESEVGKKGREIVQDLIKKRIAKISDGAAIINFEKYGLGVWVLLRKDGTVLYSAKDLALAEKKFNEYKITSSLYVVGAAQRLHFSQLFKALEIMKFKYAKRCQYVPVTEVRLPWGKMSSRTGENVLYSSFKKELFGYAKEEINKRHKLSKKELEERALAISISALKYAMLKQDVSKTITFNKEEAIRFEGDTGPYLLYSYARAKSILKKAEFNSNKKYSTHNLNDLEKNLIFQLNKFPQTVRNAYESLAPNLIANYIFETAQLFNEFYHSNQVIGSENEQFRLVLVESFSQVVKNALFLLGISTIEKM